MFRMKTRYWTRLAILATFVILNLGSGITAADIMNDAHVILSSRDGKVKRWETPPQFIIIHDDKIEISHIRKTIDLIKKSTGLELPQPQFYKLQFGVAENSFYTKSRFGIETLSAS